MPVRVLAGVAAGGHDAQAGEVGAPPEGVVELAVDRPFSMTVRYELSSDSTDDADGTLVTIHATGSPGWFFWWATPLVARKVRDSIAADLDRLRGCLEP